jgi:hypothetical protein
MTDDARKRPDPSKAGRPLLSAAGTARKSEREARLARALRDNLRRRKADLAGRGREELSPPED